MTELAFPLDELDEAQYLRRRGPYDPFWRGKRLRRTARVAITGLDRQRVSVVLRQIRDSVNSGDKIVEAVGPADDAEPMAVKLPPREKLLSLGASACELPVIKWPEEFADGVERLVDAPEALGAGFVPAEEL